MSITTLTSRYGVNDQTLRKQYKEKYKRLPHLGALDHAERYILYSENLGPDMSLDETCRSNGDIYTILTNKAAHGGKGALAAMVRGVTTDTGVLKKILFINI